MILLAAAVAITAVIPGSVEVKPVAELLRAAAIQAGCAAFEEGLGDEDT